LIKLIIYSLINSYL